MHHRAVELIEPGLLAAGRREGPISLAPAVELPPHAVAQLCGDGGVDLLAVVLGIAVATVLAPPSAERVDRPDLLLHALEVIVPHRLPDLLPETGHRPRGRPARAKQPLWLIPTTPFRD
jgi:hypothetical protein